MNEYKCINVSIYDPANSIFKSSKNDKARVTYLFCNNCENCEAYQNKKCFLRNGLYGMFCPYGKRTKEEGYTSRARNYYSKISSWKNRYENVGNTLSQVNNLCEIGDYIFLPLDHLKNYVNSIDKEMGICEEHLIPKENFTVENIIKLINYVPRALFDNSPIYSYQEQIPEFIRQLKKKYPELYKLVLKEKPSIEVYTQNIDYTKKKALVKTLKPGEVVLLNKIVNWDGEYIFTNEKDMCIFGLNDNEIVRITPTDNTIVEIYDNDTVDEEKTVFV